MKDRNDKIIQLLKDGLTYQEIADQFELTRQRIYSIRQQAEKSGHRFVERSLGRRRGLLPQRTVQILIDHPHKTYEELTAKYGFTTKQLSEAAGSARRRGIPILCARTRYENSSHYKSLCKDIKDGSLSFKEIAERHKVTVGSVHTMARQLRRKGDIVPYRGSRSPYAGIPRSLWRDNALREKLEEAVQSDVSLKEIAQRFGVTYNHVQYVVRFMRKEGVDVPRRGNGSKSEKSSRRLEIEKAIQSDASVKEIAERFGVTYWHVQNITSAMRKEGIIVPDRRNRISPRKRASIKKACVSGQLDNSSIARKYNVSRRTVGRINNDLSME